MMRWILLLAMLVCIWVFLGSAFFAPGPIDATRYWTIALSAGLALGFSVWSGILFKRRKEVRNLALSPPLVIIELVALTSLGYVALQATAYR